MRLTLEMGWHHMHRALGKLRRDSYRALAFNVSFAELNEKQFPGHGASAQFKVSTTGNVRSQYLRNICKFAGLTRICPIPKNATPSHIDNLHTSIRTYR
jgi:hypothetical protein